ncbi:MAG: hypothetical protein IJH12_04490 [Clostridia bacterium]|nr:hypothetical protein [Clostridia bacterium]
MTFDELKKINEDKLEEYKKVLNNSDVNIQKEILIHEKIKEIFDENPAIFFQIPLEEALKILSKLVKKEELRDVYTSLIQPDKYEKLRNDFDI